MRPKCEDCKNHKQINGNEFMNLPYSKKRLLDCKNLIPGGQCCCYSKEHEDWKKFGVKQWK